jgi:ABC-type branched-subunit amino acid transport system permease subunit
VGAYAAALSQKYWFPGQIVLPLLFTIAFIAVCAALVGFLILRRRGVYFSLLTLALSALTFAVAFRWTDFTGGESGLGGIVRPVVAGIDLDQSLPYLVFVSLIAFAVLYCLHRLIRSPFGHTIVAIRENEQRARFQGYATIVYKLQMFIISATVTGLAGALLAFHHRFASAEPTSVAFSGELLAMVVIGGMRSFLGPALGALFYILFRECLSIWTENWLLWFGLAFVGFILFSPTGLVGIWRQLLRRLAAGRSGRRDERTPDRRWPAAAGLPATAAPAGRGPGSPRHRNPLRRHPGRQECADRTACR